MPNIVLVPVQMLMKLTQNPAKEISTCVAKRIPTNLRKSVKLDHPTLRRRGTALRMLRRAHSSPT